MEGRLKHFLHQVLEKMESISLLNFIKGFPEYFATFISVIRNPFTFPRRVDMQAVGAEKKAVKYMFFSIVIMFFMLLPIMQVHKEELPKIPFILYHLASLFGGGVCWHFTFKIMGGRGASLWNTVTAYLYGMGTIMPIVLLSNYPAFIKCGLVYQFYLNKDSKLCSDPSVNMPELSDSAFIQTYPEVVGLLLIFIFIILVVMMVGFLIIGFLPIRWMYKMHGLRKRYVLLCLPVYLSIISPLIIVMQSFFAMFGDMTKKSPIIEMIFDIFS